MTRWFRFYDDTINDPKILKLSDRLYRVWLGMLCLASKNNGVLPSFDDMVIMLRTKAEKLQPELEHLIKAELLDHTDAGIVPHNWSKRQYKSDVSNERVKQHRERQRNVTHTVTVTPPDTETESETEQNRILFGHFWDAYPRKKGKGQAERAFKAALKAASADEIMAGLSRVKWPSDPQFIKHPATWLNGRCWLDEPDPMSNREASLAVLQQVIDGVQH